MDEIILEANEKMEKTIENLLERFKTIRAGRANPAILDGVKVEYYGTPTPLNQLATVSVPEARRLQIKPFDKSCLANIEKAIFEADLGLTPNNTGELIFIAIPELTEDRRREFVKQAKTLAEEAKIALRNIRQDANNAIKKDEEINEIRAKIDDLNASDSIKEKLRKELKKYTKDATTLIVAQRIGTIMNADKIVVLDKGVIVGIGKHKELLKNCDVYKEIAYSQLSKEELENE